MAHRLRPAMLWPIIFAALALPYVEVSARACSCRAHIRKASRKRWQSNASKRLKPVREMGLEPTRQRHRNLNPARLPIPPLAQSPSAHGENRYARMHICKTLDARKTSEHLGQWSHLTESNCRPAHYE